MSLLYRLIIILFTTGFIYYGSTQSDVGTYVKSGSHTMNDFLQGITLIFLKQGDSLIIIWIRELEMYVVNKIQGNAFKETFQEFQDSLFGKAETKEDVDDENLANEEKIDEMVKEETKNDEL